MNTLSDWLNYIEKAHNQEIDMGLSRIRQVASKLCIDFTDKLVVTVAGTNGKGSTCRFIEQALVAKGISVGVYSSPHIIRFNERIRIDGQEASNQLICNLFAQISNATLVANNGEKVSLTYFEYATLAAFLAFLKNDVDVVILEVGLGGRLDATNIIDADIAVITSIGLDHQDYLGHTLSEIAAEKAGIIKPQKSVVIGYDNPQKTLLEQIKPENKSLLRGRDFDISTKEKAHTILGTLDCEDKLLSIDLTPSRIPQQNVMTALATLLLISKSKKLNQKHCTLTNKLLETDFVQNLISVVSMPGRFEICRKEPTVILDVAHNQAAAELVVKQAKKINYGECFIIIGMLKDKNIVDTIQTLNQLKPIWYCTDLPGSRSAKKETLSAAIETLGQTAYTFDSIKQAYERVLERAKDNDLVLVLGSFVVASEFKLQCDQLKGLTT